MDTTAALRKYIGDHKDYVLNLTRHLASIPSMTGSEKKKAQYIYEVLEGITEGNLRLDHAGNVLYMHPGADRTRMDMYAAHIDTVFHDLKEIVPRVEGDRIYAPSIFDNSVNVASLIFLIKMVHETGFIPARDVMFAFDVGEEGEGDLKGIRHIMKHLNKPLHQFIALDMGYQAVMTCGVWSRRFLVEVSSAGGHSWHDFGSDSAVAQAALLVAKLYECSVPEDPRTIYNVGKFSGGSAINAVAGSARFSVDLRSESKEALEGIEQQLMGIIDSVRSKTTSIDISCIGERPGGMISPEHPLVQRIDRIRKDLGLEKRYRSSSTDANLPLSLGIPAVTIGTALGGGVHSLGEYLETDSIGLGLEQLVLVFRENSRKKKED